MTNKAWSGQTAAAVARRLERGVRHHAAWSKNSTFTDS
jgi:hypothetical protein